MGQSFYTNVLQYGNFLLVREVKNGERNLNKRVKYSPTLFAPVRKETPYKTLDGKYVTDIKFDTIKEAKEHVEAYKSQPELIYGNTLHTYSYIADQYKGHVEFDIDQLMMATIDIEVKSENGFPSPTEAKEELLSITIKNHQSKKIVVWGIGDFTTERKDVTYVKCESEVHLLKEFIVFWERHYPDIITGWNTEFFDIPYICNRIVSLFGEDELKRLSPWGSVREREVYQLGRRQQAYDIAGIASLDFMALYRKFTYTAQESYALNHIATVELGEQKDGNPYETFSEWYQKDWQSFIEYNIQDVEIVDKLEDKMRLVELCLTMAYDAKVNYTDVLGSVKYWDILIYNYLRERNIVIPQKVVHEKSEKFEGAYVKEPQVGMHKWVMSFDLNSLYPHLIMQYNISPETLIPSEPVTGLVDKLLEGKARNETEHCMTPNGAFFRKDKRGFLPEIMETMYNDRTKYKKLMLQASQEYENTKNPRLLKDISKYNNIQMAKKISLNSAYGAIGNNYFRYYDLMIASAITTSGQLSIRWIEKSLNIYLNKLLETKNEDYVIASDTDSVYITFDRLVDKLFGEGKETRTIVNFLDKIAKEKLEPFIENSYTALAKVTNAYEQKMVMSREVIADKGIWTAKKRYILNVYNDEGVELKQPKLKIMGIEAVKSSTPAPCRVKIKEALSVIMNQDESSLIQFIDDFRNEFKKLSPEAIAYPRSCNNLRKYSSTTDIYQKGTPMHVRGALLYNNLLKKHKLKKYESINDGDKIKFVQLKEPNPLRENIISFVGTLPKEFDLHRYIDYDIQFEKSFLDPLRFIVNAIDWSFERQSTLDDFF